MTSKKHIYWVFIFLGLCLKPKAQDLKSFSTKNPIKVNGSLTARTTFYTAQQLASRRVPFGWQLSGSATVNLLNGFQVPFSFMFSEQNRSFSQPFNQFGMSPRYKGYTAHAGYRNLSFSEFTLAGQSIFGGGAEMQKGKIRVGFMAGRFQRATAGYGFGLPTFYRQGWAGRIGFGTNDNFIDLIVLNAADKASSIANYTNKPGLSPERNTVLGLNFRKQFFKKLTLASEVALSLYTIDQTAKTADSLNLPTFAEDFLQYNISSEPTLAIKSSLEYRGNSWGLGLVFQQIDAGYKSMGAYYLYNDMQMLTATPNFSFLNGKVNLTSNIIHQTDNLKKQRSITTKRLSPSVGLSFNISQQFGLDFQGQYFNTSQTIAQGKTANPDDLQNNTLYSITASPRWNLTQPTVAHSINLAGGWQTMADQNALSKQYTEFKSITAGAFYALSLITSQTSFNVGANYSGFNTLTLVSKPTYSFNGGANRSFDKGRYSASINSSLSLSEYSNATNFSGSFAYSLNKHHSLNASISALWLNFAGDTRPGGREQRATLQYSYRF